MSSGDFALGRLIEPRLTYVYDGAEEIGQYLVEMIQASFEKRLEKRSTVLRPQLILNQSVRDLTKGEV